MTNDISMKKAIFEDFYSHLVNFEILVAMRINNVICPFDLMQNDFVKFAIGSGAAKDMKIDEEGVEVNITFSRQPFTCFFPWESIVNIESPFFVFGQKFNPLEEVQENKAQSQQPINSVIPEKEEMMGEDGDWILKDTKYSHLKLLTKKEHNGC